MKQALLAAALLLAPSIAYAQAPQEAQASAAQATVMDQFQLLIGKNAKIATLQAQVADLQKQLAAAKPAPKPEAPPAP